MKVSKHFFTELFGWTSQDMPTGQGRPDYTMFSLQEKYVAGGSPAFDPHLPSYWNNYISVEHCDEMTKKAESLGAKITMQPMDVLDSGRMSTIQDPTGAYISLWQPKKHIGASIVNTPGAMSWNELYTKDVEKAKQFYEKLFGWTYEIDEENEGYVTIKNNGRRNGGMYAMKPDMEQAGMVPSWVVYFSVKDLDKTVSDIKELNGQVYMQKKVNVGKIAMAADPTHASFMLIQMNIPPEEWKE
jgi:uncharacterized protein